MQFNTVYQLWKIGLSQDEPSCLCVEVMEVGVRWRRGKSVPVFNHGVNSSAADDDRTTRGTWHLVASAWVRVRSRAISPFPWACAPLLTKERESWGLGVFVESRRWDPWLYSQSTDSLVWTIYNYHLVKHLSQTLSTPRDPRSIYSHAPYP